MKLARLLLIHGTVKGGRPDFNPYDLAKAAGVEGLPFGSWGDTRNISVGRGGGTTLNRVRSLNPRAPRAKDDGGWVSPEHGGSRSTVSGECDSIGRAGSVGHGCVHREETACSAPHRGVREVLFSALGWAALLIGVAVSCSAFCLVGFSRIEERKTAHQKGKALKAAEQQEAAFRRKCLVAREHEARLAPGTILAVARIPAWTPAPAEWPGERRNRCCSHPRVAE